MSKNRQNFYKFSKTLYLLFMKIKIYLSNLKIKHTPHYLLSKAFKRALSDMNVRVYSHKTGLFVFSDIRCIILPPETQTFLLSDIRSNFDTFFNAVKYSKIGRFNVVNCTQPQYQQYKGFNLFPVLVPSYGEPIETNYQYTNFANLNENSIVLDLGVFSGLSAIIFDQDISKNNKNAIGKVISVEPDKINYKCAKENLEYYYNVTGRKIDILEAAAWKEDAQLSFYTEGAMGSSIIAPVGKKVIVQGYKLSSIAKIFNLEHIDFIKCDIEGAEVEIFKDTAFFNKFHPKMVIEPHLIKDVLCTDIVLEQLKQIGYQAEVRQQDGFNSLPLIFAEWKGK